MGREKGYNVSEETKEKIRQGHLGKKVSKEVKQKMSLAHTGEKAYNYGKSPSKRTKQKLSKSHIGLNTWLKGKPRSEETKRKIREGHIGKKKSLEVREKMSNAHAGRMPPCSNKTPYGHIKRGTYNINGKEIFFRSKWEANYALYLDFLIKQKQIKKWEYEKDVFVFEKIKFGTRSYRPDFKVFNNDKTIEYHEVKGFLVPRDKTKFHRFKKYFPEEFSKLWFVTGDPFAKSEANGKMVGFFLDDLKVSFDRLISYNEIKNKLGVIIF